LTAEELNVGHAVFDWLLKHATFICGRYLVHDDGQTSYERRWQKNYASSLCNFRETVMAKRNLPTTGNSTSHWQKGIWLGRCPGSNDIIVALQDGTVRKVRTFKRLPPSEQTDKELLLSVTGRPSCPKGDGELDTEFVVPQALVDQLRTAAELAATLPPQLDTEASGPLPSGPATLTAWLLPLQTNCFLTFPWTSLWTLKT
jgi:hypothetical protein